MTNNDFNCSFQLLTSNLVQNGNDDEGITGFMPKDIKAEVSRTKKLVSDSIVYVRIENNFIKN